MAIAAGDFRNEKKIDLASCWLQGDKNSLSVISRTVLCGVKCCEFSSFKFKSFDCNELFSEVSNVADHVLNV